MHDPEVLILDEPTSGLDPNQLVEIRALIKSFGKDKTVLFSTHIMQEVEAICDRVIIINNGKIVADESISQIHQNKENKQIISVSFDKEINLKLFKIEGCKVKSEGNNNYLFSTNTEIDIRKEIAKLAIKNDVLVLEMKMVEDNLEDIFKELTK